MDTKARNAGIESVKQKLVEHFGSPVLTFCEENSTEYYISIEESMVRGAAGYLYLELGFPLVTMFANDERPISGHFYLYAVFADAKHRVYWILRAKIKEETIGFPSLASMIPPAAYYEREMKDLYGLTPIGLSDAKPMVFHGNWPLAHHPLRKEYPTNKKPEWAHRKMSFLQVKGEGIFEVPVGPVHAGIIEPGHFRFSVAGEPIIHLEAQLYYVHKGIEKLCEGETIERGLFFSERISGDESFANSLAYCLAAEKLSEVIVPKRAAFTRIFFAEMERLTSHLGDLAGLCLDTGYGFATYQFRLLRGWTYLAADYACQSRFLRGINCPGGIRKDFLLGKEGELRERLNAIKKELTDTIKIVTANSLFIDRVEHTGILKREIANDLHAVGPGARASGVFSDVRKDFPYEGYDELDFTVPCLTAGDIQCRMSVKMEECLQALSLMEQVINQLSEGTVRVDYPLPPPYRFACGTVESARGESVHWLMSGPEGRIYRYKIRTASFCNWPVLCHAVTGNIIPDFPLINKSFNLSYAGNDL